MSDHGQPTFAEMVIGELNEARERKGDPYNLGVGRNGPLPRGWHRVTWRDDHNRPHFLLTDDVRALTDVSVALKFSYVAVDVETQSWSDEGNTSR